MLPSQVSQGGLGNRFAARKLQIVAVTDLGLSGQPLFNIEVADNNNYFAGGVLVHNCEHLEAVGTGHIKRLIINIPPRHMKSISVAVAWPAWAWIQDRSKGPLMGPNIGFLANSYAQTLSIRDNVKCRRLIESPWYQKNWGDRFALTSDQNTKIKFENDQGGYRIATSIDGTSTGEGGDICLVDDPISAKDAGSETVRQRVMEWWDGTMSSRLNDPKTGAYVVIMQRLHEQDLVGHILDKQDEDWVHLCLPARYESNHPAVYDLDPRSTDGELLWPARMGEKEVAKLETSMGSYVAAGQLQQRPAPREGGMFKRRWFAIVDAAPAGLLKVRRWDLAATVPAPGRDPDWTAGLLMGRDNAGFFYIMDVTKLQGSSHEVETTIFNTAKQDGTSVTIGLPQDPGQAGKAQVAALIRMLAGYVVKAAPETGSKEVRASAFEAQCEAGNVKLIKGAWNEAFLSEIEVFPFGKHDDQVDVAAGAFNLLADGSNAQQWVDHFAKLAGDARARLEQ